MLKGEVRGESVQAGDVKHTWSSLTRQRGARICAEVPLEEGLRREAEWYRTLGAPRSR